MNGSKNGSKLLWLMLFTIIVYGLYSNITCMQRGDLSKIEVSNTYVSVTPKPTVVPTPTTVPATPVIRTLVCDGYVNITSVNERSFPEIKNDNIISSLYIGDKVMIKETYEFNNKIWYKTSKNLYVYSDYITLDKTKTETISRGGVERKGINTTITEESNLTTTQINYLLKDGGMEGLSESILYCERLFRVNALFIIAVGRHESANGNSRLARTKNNLFGVNAYGDVDKNATDYTSKNESIYAFSKLIRNNYFNKGLTDIHLIGSVYCESGDWADLIDETIGNLLSRLEKLH